MQYKKNNIVVGIVSGITKYGIFVKFDNLYSGLIHISEISEKFVCNISNYVNCGDKIKVKILEVDNYSYQLKLSIKNLDYKIINIKKDKKIIETPNGFITLGKKLDFWIKEYLKNKKINKYY